MVIKEPPYIGLGFMKSTSIKNGKLEYTRKREEALIVSSQRGMEAALKLINENNRDRNKVYVMDWITEIGNKKRIWHNDIVW